MGLFGEALIYYDTVRANITNQPQLAEFLRWFIDRGLLDDLISLLHDGAIEIYDYAFATAAILDPSKGEYSLWNIQDEVQAQANTFERRFLYHKDIEALFPKARQRSRIYDAFRGRVIEAKSIAFGAAVDNAKADFLDPKRCTLILQTFVDELYSFRNMGAPPRIQANVVELGNGKTRIEWNVDINALAKIGGKELNFNAGAILSAGGMANRLILSAGQLGCDLYLPEPMGMLVGDKLFESTQRIAKAGSIIDQLQETVEFPDVRALVNDSKIDFREIIRIRNKAGKFRSWLQEESERDREAIIAYHNETAKELGLLTAGRKALSLFGFIGGGAIGSLAGTAIAGPAGGIFGGAIGGVVGYLSDVVAKMGADWKPVVFGRWFRDRIAQLYK